jgi:hypothetical protein
MMAFDILGNWFYFVMGEPKCLVGLVVGGCLELDG